MTQSRATLATEELTCPTCGSVYERTLRRGPKPKRCESCKQSEAERARERYRAGAWAEAPHGSRSRYFKGGCRCEPCRLAGNRASREKYARRKARGLPGMSGTVESTCKTCGATIRTDRKRKYCGRDCYRLAVGNAPLSTWWITIGNRLAIYHRDGYRCQICSEPVDMTADACDTKAPTLDHIVPRSRGGGDEPGNLRLACRGCNARRGSDVDAYLPEFEPKE